MSDYDYETAPRAASSVIMSGAWLGAIAGIAGLGWLDTHMPHLAAFALDWVVVLAVCYVMARWKRAWYAWLAFWGMAGACVLCGILQLAGAMAGRWSGASWVVACVMVFIWYWLIRMPRLRGVAGAVERREIHVFHHVFHHVIHHGQELPGWTSAEVTGAPPGARKVIAGSARAIGPARMDPAPHVRRAIAGALARRRR